MSGRPEFSSIAGTGRCVAPRKKNTGVRRAKWFSGAAALVICAGAMAEEYRLVIASSHTAALPWVGVMSTHVVPQSNQRLEAMGSPHRIRWTEAYGGSLYNYEGTLESIEIGLTDMGWVGTLWELSKMPLQNVTYYTPFVTDDFQLLSDVVNDLHETEPVLVEAWTAQNQHFLGASVVDTYHLMTNFPVDSVDDLRGRKILAPGPSASWLEGTGAVAVEGSLSTYYTQIQTGVADGVLTILTGAPAYRIHEVAPYITLVGIGSQFMGAMSINLDTWNSLPDDVQTVLADLGRVYSAQEASEVESRYDRFLELMESEGAIVTVLRDEERLKWLDGLPNIAGSWAEATERRGVPAKEMLGIYMNAMRERGVTPLRDWDLEE